MASTRAILRQRTVEVAWGQLITFTTTSSVDATSVIATGLINFIGGGDTDYYENWYSLLTSGNNSGEDKRVSAYDGTSDATVAEAYTNTVASSVTGEMLPWAPDFIHECILTAGRLLSQYIYLPIVDETLVTDQLLTNSDFEGSFSDNVPANWTEDDSGTQATNQETSRVFHGANSVSLAVSSGSADRSIYQDQTINIANLVDRTLTFGGLMWATVKDAGYFQIDYGDGGTSDSPKHAGDEDWQNEQATLVVPSNASRIRLRAYADDASTPTVFFDALYAYAYPITRYLLPSAFIGAPDTIEIATSRLDPNLNYERVTNWGIEKDGETEYIRFGEHLPSGFRLRLKGRGALTLPSSDSTSMEVEDHRIDLIATYAASIIFERLAAGTGGEDAAEYEAKARKHFNAMREMLSIPGMKMLQGTNLRYPTK